MEKVESVFGRLRKAPERPNIEDMDGGRPGKSRAESDEKWSRGEKPEGAPEDSAEGRGRGRQRQGGGEGKLSWRQEEGPGLNKTDNAWKPGRGRDGADEKTLKKVNGLLNKLTLEKFDSLLDRFLELPIDSPELLRSTINLIFDKATSEDKFCPMYANLCKQLSQKFSEEAVQDMEKFTDTEDGKKETFRRLLLNQCQEEFEKEKKMEVLTVEEIAALEPAEREQALIKERKTKIRSLGNVLFIGELFKEKMLNEVIMHECVVRLLKAPEGADHPDDESLECLCKLLTTVGSFLDHAKVQGYMNKYFKQVAKYQEEKGLSSRIRFMLQDLRELREAKWAPRAKEEGPKTIAEVHQDAMDEEMAANRNKGGGRKRGGQQRGGAGRNGPERVRPTVTRGDSSATMDGPTRKTPPAQATNARGGPMVELESYLRNALQAQAGGSASSASGAEEAKVPPQPHPATVSALTSMCCSAGSTTTSTSKRDRARSLLGWRCALLYARRDKICPAPNQVLRPAHLIPSVAKYVKAVGWTDGLALHLQQRWRRSLGALSPFLAWCTRKNRALQLAALHE